ncbi:MULTISPECIES: hypothetical protein [Tepidibacter]|uniref:Spo0E like sporulation regulatory protein n=2 Tax=Tepidibacter TaxID=214904 RepID=A0A1M5NJH1_9FIRM|nr:MULTISPECIES: hypothetical protein [Tepidibacter]SHG89671.1 hypothetical protein SAMN02744040_00075 [Tepidibacter thalassicus DSM 15285]SHJ75172.1 hypothetical protein SAMN02744037_00748 [Tepidibacter formicigenes DSM 15518]
MTAKEKLEQERKRLHLLIENGGSKEEIQEQSEILDQCITEFYLIQKGA